MKGRYVVIVRDLDAFPQEIRCNYLSTTQANGLDLTETERKGVLAACQERYLEKFRMKFVQFQIERVSKANSEKLSGPWAFFHYLEVCANGIQINPKIRRPNYFVPDPNVLMQKMRWTLEKKDGSTFENIPVPGKTSNDSEKFEYH